VPTGGTLMNQWKPREAKWEHVTWIIDMIDRFFNVTVWVLIKGRILTALTLL